MKETDRDVAIRWMRAKCPWESNAELHRKLDAIRAKNLAALGKSE